MKVRFIDLNYIVIYYRFVNIILCNLFIIVFEGCE